MEPVNFVRGAAAVMLVHIYGRRATAGWPVVPVIEDLAEAHGLKPQTTSVAACWSFYKNKIVGGEEGGAVLFNHRGAAKQARKLRNMGFNDAHNFYHLPRCMNYRLSNANAELILDSLSRYEDNLAKRRKRESLYNDLVPKEWQMPSRDAPWVYDLLLPAGVDNEYVVNSLNAKDVEARVGFKPMSIQPEYLGHYEHLNAYRLSKRIMYLPLTPELAKDRVRQAVDLLHMYVDYASARK
jgi:dTDP-4-amino-4,6-dideoxygalactose transaminase